MNILMVNNYFYLRGGSEKVMFEEMALLAARGHEVAGFSAADPRNAKSPLGSHFPEVLELSGLGTLARARQVHHLVTNPAVERSFERALDAFRPDVVHFHNIYGRLTPVVAEVARRRAIPSVMTAHDYKLICPSYLRLSDGSPCSACSYGRYAPALLRRCHKGSRAYSIVYAIESTVNVALGRYAGISRFLCPSQFLLQSFAEKGVSRSKLRHVPNFLSAPASPAPPAREAAPYVLYAGRLSHEKGVACLLRAMKGLEVELRVAGDGPELRGLQQLVADLEVGSRVRFLGHCDRPAMTASIAGARCVVVPSEWFENAPMVILEAFAQSRPVVGAHIGGIPELVIADETGMLFPPGDHDRLRGALERMIAAPAEADRMGANGRRLVETRFSAEVHVRGLLDAYREAQA